MRHHVSLLVSLLQHQQHQDRPAPMHASNCTSGQPRPCCALGTEPTGKDCEHQLLSLMQFSKLSFAVWLPSLLPLRSHGLLMIAVS